MIIDSNGLTDAQIALLAAVEVSPEHATPYHVTSKASAFLKWLKENS